MASLAGTAFLSSAAVAQSSSPKSGSRWADGYSPTEIHQVLAQRKAESLLRARQMLALEEAEKAVPSAQTDFDVQFYEVTLRIDDTAEVVWGKVTMIADATVSGVATVQLDFYSNMSVDSIVAPTGNLSFSRAGNVVTFNLDGTYNSGEQFQFDFWYHGTPITGGLQAFEFGTHSGEPAISTLSEPYFARTWWPCKDRMDDKPDSMRSHIEVDTSLYCASNGTLDSITAAAPNSRVFHYTMSYPMTTYLFSLAIHPYTVWNQEYLYNGGADSMPITHHVYPDWDSYSRPRWGLTPEIMGALAGSFGEYPFLQHGYGHANFNWSGGMEHQTVTSMVGSSFGFSEDVVAHEMAHQWWGDMITCESWQDIWLNEGWASYAEAVWHLAKYGWADYRDYMMDMAYYGSGTVWVEPADTSNVWAIFNTGLSYNKGAWVVHMLRGVLGEFKFFQGVQAYYDSEYKYAAATTEDFKNVFETATGEELDWFFDEWIYGTYYPRYEYSYYTEPSDSAGYEAYLVVNQVQTSNPRVFHMPVDFLFLFGASGSDTIVYVCDERSRLFKLNSPAQVTGIQLDPANWILKSATQRAWTMHIITFREELSDGRALSPYVDTIQSRGGSGNNQVTVIGGALPPGLSINSAGIISGTPSDSGDFGFTIRVLDPVTAYADSASFSIHVDEAITCCTGPSMGNVDVSPDNLIGLGDLTVLIDHLFVSFADLPCVDEANLDLSPGGEVTLADLTILIDHLFVTFADLPPCPGS